MSFFDSLEQIRIGSLSLAAILSAFLVLIVCLIARKVLNRIFTRIMEKSHLDGSVKSFLSAAVNVLLWAVLINVVAEMLGISTTSLVAVVSVAGLALSLSIQGILENLFSGMTVLGTKPFSAGDYVDIGGTTGTVTSLGLFYTVITTIDGKTVHIPNSSVTSAKITNYSSNPSRRIELSITASYDDPPEKVKAALLAAAADTPGILDAPAPFAGVANYGSSSIEYSLFAWAPTGDFTKVKFDLTEKVFTAFSDAQVTMTYDHLNVHITEK